MATKTEIYELRKKEENDFYNIEDFNNNMDTLEKALTEFDDSGTAEGVTSFPEMLTKLVTGNKLAITLKNLKAGLQFVLHAGSIVNNCVTDNANLPVSAAMAKSLQDQINQANSNLEWKYVADVIGSSTINIPSDACEIFVTVTKSSAIYDGVTTLSLLVPVRILSTVYQDFLNGGYGNNDQQTYLAFFRINKYNAHLYALKVAGQDYTATSQLKMWYR